MIRATHMRIEGHGPSGTQFAYVSLWAGAEKSNQTGKITTAARLTSPKWQTKNI